MPTVTLTFSLPDERTEHMCAVHGGDLHAILWDINARLRQLIKHGGVDQLTSLQVAEEIQGMVRDGLSLIPE
jgi:hypothetical protein